MSPIVRVLAALSFLLSCYISSSCDRISVDNDVIVEHSNIVDSAIANRFAKVDSSGWLYRVSSEDVVTCTGVEAAKRRAEQLATICWTPRGGPIPSRYGVYSPTKTYSGIPYSLAIMTDTFVGTQTSLYTFLTAVDNPESVLYSEDLRKPPYNGFDCAPYYGSTCSNSVMYALDIKPPYYTYMIPSIKGMNRAQRQAPECVQPCDVLLKAGHVVMVYDVVKSDDGNLQQVSIFETTSKDKKDTWIHVFTSDEFIDWWEKGGYVRYEYSYLSNVSYSPSLLVPLHGEIVGFDYQPLELCTTLGDCATYWQGQDVIITVNVNDYETLAVFKDDILLLEQPITFPLTVLSDLPCGQYKVRLSDKDGYFGSHFTSFEVIDATVTGRKGETIWISFSSDNARPCYVCICDGQHNPYNYYMLSDADCQRGYFDMALLNHERSTHYKVYFKGKYNVIASEIKEF